VAGAERRPPGGNGAGQSQQHFPQHGPPSQPQVQDGQSQQHASVQQASVQ
jgi:hypothetical protein